MKKEKDKTQTEDDNPKSRREKEQKAKEKQKLIISLFVFLVILVMFAGATYYLYVYYTQPEDSTKVMPYTELIKNISNGNVEKVEMTVGSTGIKVKLKDEDEPKSAVVPNLQAFTEFIQTKVEDGNEIEVIQKMPNALVGIGDTIFTILPTLIMVALIVMLFKMQSFGSKGKVYSNEEDDTNTTFEDIAGLDEEKKEMIEIVNFLKKPEEFAKMGARVPRGVLLCGKPGTGKTLIAKAIAGEANVPFISISGSEFIEMFAGLGASRVRGLFDKARKLAPCIVFIDEIDAIGARRTTNSGADTENNQTLNQLLVEMDGFESDEGIIVLAATNRPEMLDQALLRAGRFDRQIIIAPPDKKGRIAILKIHSKDKKLADDVNFDSIAEDTSGFTGAELANILNEAAIIATVKKQEAITNSDIEEAIKKVTVGLEKNSRIISEKDRKLTAYHEAGHAVVSRYLPTQNEVKEISIIPRGVAGGYTMYKNDEDKYYISKTEMEEKMIALLGGRAAEKIVLNDISTGASNDIEVATGIAKDMITVYGMSDTIGPISLNERDNPNELLLYGDKIKDAINAEIKIIINDAYEKAQRLIIMHRDKLDQIAELLLKQEKISEKEFEEIFKDENLKIEE